ncbi:alpha/beta hydrolase [Pseudooceanicola sp.]|uniref:alpha/beta fold hydrolase n=1 Tax=Pseudooceanicola sp. TaxID=1914328 RepID=UPI00261085D2|nr:alpha/beta hydrolase [Pseudooceanicola sp.]MDF1857296.1 alpha/beta hydrolase [Pseudooceanicola sp.]
MTWAALIFGLLVAGFLAPFLIELRRPKVDKAARAASNGKLARLSQGITHFRWHSGKARGPVAICVHGLTTPSFVWDGVADELEILGYRVLSYDLFGRGLSDRPAAPQNRDFFVRQLEELIKHEGIKEDITLIGYSMGGSIATCYAAKNPHMLRRLVLIAPAGMGLSRSALDRFMIGAPLIGDWLFRVVFPGRHRRAARRLQRDHGVSEAITNAQAAQVEYRGYLPAVLSSYRRILSETLEAEHREIAHAGIPVTGIWATADQTIPLANMGRLTAWNREAVQTQILGATHWLPITHPREVVRAFRDAVHR